MLARGISTAILLLAALGACSEPPDSSERDGSSEPPDSREGEPEGGTTDSAPCVHTRCGDECVDTASDAQHCGACGHRCGRDQVCCEGACEDTVGEVGSSLVSQNACGHLIYGRYANQRDPDAEESRPARNIVPDFSFAGYRRGGVAIPDVPERARVEPEPGDDRARIQAAIDEVSELPLDDNGFRGAVLLTRGRYEVSDSLFIRASGVVLRGEGQGTDGTIVVATKREKHSLIHVQGEGSHAEVEGSRVDIRSPFVPVGARSLEVSDGRGFSAGDSIVIERRPNQAWIDTLDMGRYGWTPSGYVIGHERTVVTVDGDQVRFDIPVVDAIDEQYGGGQVYRSENEGMIERCGIEDLRLDSVYSGPEDEDHAWRAIELRQARSSWVRRVTAVHFAMGMVGIAGHSKFNTVEDSAAIDFVSRIAGSRRYPFHVFGGASGNLFQRCYARDARHAFATSSRVPGPNVWLDCVSEHAHSDDGPHHRWATGLLYDNTLTTQHPEASSSAAGTLRVHNRADSGTGHGWAGAQVMFYNAEAHALTADAPRGAMNWVVGSVGERRASGRTPDEPPGIWESEGVPVSPRSLYLAQLEQRLGPAAVEAVTMPEQRARRIWDMLAEWRGEGRLEEVSADPMCETGIASDGICCAASCDDKCTGTGCGGAPGGGQNCCASVIQESGRSCANVGPPCVMEE